MKLICSIWLTCVILYFYAKKDKAMKQNQLIITRVGDYSQPIDPVTMMGSLNSIWNYGNKLRESKGLKKLRMQEWLRSPVTVFKIIELNKSLYCTDESERILKKSGKLSLVNCNLQVYEAREGKGGGTYCHIEILIMAHNYLSNEGKVPANFMTHIQQNTALTTIEQLLGIALFREYPVGKYKIDGYDLENNVAYEINECHHRTTINAIKDSERNKFISKTLNCRIVIIDV